jgi:hypothetical protein
MYYVAHSKCTVKERIIKVDHAGAGYWIMPVMYSFAGVVQRDIAPFQYRKSMK